MCFKIKQSCYIIKNSALKNKKLIAICMVWVIFCTFWGADAAWKYYEVYGKMCSTADIITEQQYSYYTGFPIILVLIFVVMKCKADSLKSQFILRYGSRKKTFQFQILESTFYALFNAVLLITIQTVAGQMLSGHFITWNSINSVFYNLTGKTVNISYVIVLGVLCLMYFLKLLIVFLLIDILMWNQKKLFLVWVIVMVPVTLELINFEIPVLFERIAVWHMQWNITHIVGKIGYALIILLTEYFIGLKLIRKKDIFN